MQASSRQLRSDVAELVHEFSTDLTVVWRKVETAAAASDALHDILPALIDQYGAATALLAAEYYDDLRDKRGVRGRFAATPADIPETGSHALIGWASSTATDYPALQVLILGGAQRRIANFARRTVTGSSVADPNAVGWVRVGDGACDWCQQYLDGEVHYVEGYDFDAHDNCKCTAEPVF